MFHPINNTLIEIYPDGTFRINTSIQDDIECIDIHQSCNKEGVVFVASYWSKKPMRGFHKLL